MNTMYGLPVSDRATHFPGEPLIDRATKFQRTMADELDELDEIEGMVFDNELPIAQVTAMADLLGDIVVYAFSEAAKYGIPLDNVLSIIMDSNESKLGADGKPILNANGKFMKGPNYWKPEPRIQVLLEQLIRQKQSQLPLEGQS